MNRQPSFSVIICAYTHNRWADLLTAVQSIKAQTIKAKEIIIVIDHNEALYQDAHAELKGTIVIENQFAQGLSGARNSGIDQATGEILAFMDEDATAKPNWLATLAKAYSNPKVLGVGGSIKPQWVNGRRPDWFPREFDWVVGCTYLGMPTTPTPVRNLIGCNMSFRSSIFSKISGFEEGIGRIGTKPVGCEETELCIRINQIWPEATILFDPEAEVNHRVPAIRTRWHYFRIRCYSEGISKAQVASKRGPKDSLSNERQYTLHTLPNGVLKGVGDFLRTRKFDGLLRALAINLGLTFTVIGYVTGRLTQPQEIVEEVMNENKSDSTFVPALMCQIEISQPIAEISAYHSVGNSYQRAIALILLFGKPIGVLRLRLRGSDMTASTVAMNIWEYFQKEIQDRLKQERLPIMTELPITGIPSFGTPKSVKARHNIFKDPPFVSVVIATHNRVDNLKRCLESLLMMDYPNYDIVVVDNAPSNSDTADYVQETYGSNSKVRYLHEPTPGLAIAHNRGLQEVTAPYVAFTDDDVIVNADWLTHIIAGFVYNKNVGCVTGMIWPAEIETPAQELIEQYGGFSKGFEQKLYDMDEHRQDDLLYPYTAGKFGSGANMSFKTAVLKELNGFDPALGAGSQGMGGDDLAAFFQVVASNHTLVYEPAAIIHHWHYRDYSRLQKTAFGYGVGLTAYLTSTLLKNPSLTLKFLLRVPFGIAYALDPSSDKNKNKELTYPVELTQIERRGMIHGPIAYIRSWWHTRHLRII